MILDSLIIRRKSIGCKLHNISTSLTEFSLNAIIAEMCEM